MTPTLPWTRDAATIWPLVHAERHALVDDLAEVPAASWETDSLCRGWSVHDCAAHLVDCWKTNTRHIVASMVRVRFDFERQVEQGLRREQGATPAVTLRRMREAADRTDTPPVPLGSRLVEEVAHGEDIRRPLGLSHPYDPRAVRLALEYQVGAKVAIGGSKERVEGLRLVATDDDVVIGEGTQDAAGTERLEVRGTALALLMAVSGRRDYLDELDGDGVAALRDWRHG